MLYLFNIFFLLLNSYYAYQGSMLNGVAAGLIACSIVGMLIIDFIIK